MSSELVAKLDNAYTVRLLEELVRINSIVGQEGELARFLCTELDRLGLDCELEEVEPGRSNVYARLQGRGPGRRLNLNGHIDTVSVCEGWESDPFTPVVKQGRLYGLGACDMKAGIACAVTTLKAFVESGYPFRGELSFSGVIDEEAYSKGARAMLATDLAACDAIVVAEAYAGDADKPIPLGITGKVLYELTVQGFAAHGFYPHQGINAVEDAARIIASLDRLRMREHPDFGRGNICTLKIEGGYQVYSVVVPDRCRVEINRLLVPGETTESAVEDMRELIRSLELRSQVEVSLKPPRYEPFVMDRHEPIFDVFHQVYQEVMGFEPVYAYSPGITDANVFAGEGGIPCLHLGPQRGSFHQPNEYVEIGSLASVSRMFALIAARFLGGD